MSRFTNIFKKTDLDEKSAFRAKVIQILRQKFPEFNFSEGEDLDQISAGELTIGLTNLRAKFLMTSQTSIDLENLVVEQFGIIPQTAEYVKNLDGQETWDSVKSLVMLQIMPIEYALKFSALQFPLSEEVVIGIVVDDEKAYRYVTENDVETWKVTADEIFQTAQENLEKRSEGIEMMIIPLPVGLAVVNTMDGFDAARILLPELRKFFAENIGKPFYFGIPNRDFLICFSSDSDEESLQNFRNQIAEDNSERPYPLSPNTFVVDGKNEIKQLPFSSSQPTQKFENLN